MAEAELIDYRTTRNRKGISKCPECGLKGTDNSFVYKRRVYGLFTHSKRKMRDGSWRILDRCVYEVDKGSK
jgi:hypothetical protein